MLLYIIIVVIIFCNCYYHYCYNYFVRGKLDINHYPSRIHYTIRKETNVITQHTTITCKKHTTKEYCLVIQISPI